MTHYGLVDEADELVGGGRFNETADGSEIENFRVYDGYCYGFAQLGKVNNGFNFKRLGASPAEEEVDDVLVILVATRPGLSRQVVVGWYASATCYDTWYRRADDADPSAYGGYNFIATEDECVLLPVEERTWEIPKGKGGMGQAQVAYSRDARGGRLDRPWMRKTLRRIRQYERGNLVGSGGAVSIAKPAYRHANESPRSAKAGLFVRDPNEVDRGLAGHARTQNALFNQLCERGAGPWSPRPHEPDFDLAWRDGRTLVIAEVKSLTATNERHQIRIGLGQVLEYRHRMRRAGRKLKAVLALERAPKSAHWVAVCKAVGVALVWPATFENVLPRNKR